MVMYDGVWSVLGPHLYRSSIFRQRGAGGSFFGEAFSEEKSSYCLIDCTVYIVQSNKHAHFSSINTHWLREDKEP